VTKGVHHHASHRGLIRQSAPTSGRAPVDAIIVPSARRAAALTEVGRLAEQLGCAVLVLCSKHSEAAKAVGRLSARPGFDIIAVDFPSTRIPRLPVLETSSVLGDSKLQRRTDTSAKRNLGLVLARLLGWKRVVFLDDDIEVPDAADLERAVALLDSRDGVGLHIQGFPDNSVVCHANRDTGAPQDTFIGGGALAVPADRIDSFFPEIYNEDWFFLLGKTMLRPVGQVGVARQQPYDPYADPDRARREEFGDVLAEGLFALFDEGLAIGDADVGYWTRFLAARLALITEIRGRVRATMPAAKAAPVLESLTAASGRLLIIKPEQCFEYIQAWQRDRARWRVYMAGLSPIRQAAYEKPAIEVAAARFGLKPITRWAPESRRSEPEPAVPQRAKAAVG
jgi:hypothetical protein